MRPFSGIFAGVKGRLNEGNKAEKEGVLLTLWEKAECFTMKHGALDGASLKSNSLSEIMTSTFFHTLASDPLSVFDIFRLILKSSHSFMDHAYKCGPVSFEKNRSSFQQVAFPIRSISV